MCECSFLGMCLAVEKALTPDPQCGTTCSLVGKWSDLDRAEQNRAGGKICTKTSAQNFALSLNSQMGFQLIFHGVSVKIQHELGAKCCTFLIIYHFCFEINLAKSFHSNPDLFLTQQQQRLVWFPNPLVFFKSDGDPV